MWENYGILLVDDEPAYHAIVPALLRSLSIAVDSAASREAALRMASARPYALILMDIQLGGDDGVETAATIRQSLDWARDCPIIAFTSVCPVGGEQYFRERGFDGWISKPFEGQRLIAAVRHALDDGRDISDIVPEGGKLAALLGEEGAASMIDRLHANLAESLAEIDGGADARPIAHRMGGLAGTLGFPTLSAAWLSLQDDRAVWPTVRALTMEAIAIRSAKATK